jgi:ferritin-like metal-binding protein YciE
MTYNTSNNPSTGNMPGNTEQPQDRVREVAEQARSSAQQLASDVRSKAQDTLGSVNPSEVKQQVQSHPWLTLGALVGVGYLLSRASSGGDSRSHSYQGSRSYQNGWQGSQNGWQGSQGGWQGYQSQQPWQSQHGYDHAMEQAKHYEASQREGMVGKLGRRMLGNIGSLDEMFHQKLQETYDAEHQILKALPMMIEAASSHELKRAFDMHLRQTQGQIARLEQLFHRFGTEPRGKTCTAMRGLLAEGAEIMAMRADPEVKDAALIAGAQAVEHHEIAAYGTLRTWARQVGHHDAAQVLQQILNEEEQTDRQLTQIAEQSINRRAAHG